MIFHPDTGEKISAFTVDELESRGCTMDEVAWLVWGIPVGTPRIRLESVDGFQVRVKSVDGWDLQEVAAAIKNHRRRA